MSTATMTDDQAYDLLMEQVYVPAFFNKLAAHGIYVDSDEDAQTALRTAAKLRNAAQHEAVKTASVSRFAALEAKVDGQLKTAGVSEDRDFAFAVTKLAQDQTIAGAVLQLQTAAAKRVMGAEQPKA